MSDLKLLYPKTRDRRDVWNAKLFRGCRSLSELNYKQLTFNLPEFAFRKNATTKVYRQSKRDPEDVFHAYLVKGAVFDGKWGIPIIPISNVIPEIPIPFSETNRQRSSRIKRNWVHFFEGDRRIEKLWNRPNTYLPLLILKPCKVVVYGQTTDDICRRCEEIGASVIRFNSWFHEIHRR